MRTALGTAHADLNRRMKQGVTEAWPFVVHYSGATPDQFARLVEAEAQTVRVPSLDGALHFACRTLARGGTVVCIEGPDGLVISLPEIQAHCRAQG